VLTLGLTVPFASEWGITGAAVAMVIAYAVDVVWSFAAMRQSWSTRVLELWPVRSMLALALAYAAGLGAARGIDHLIEGMGGTACALAAGTGAYLAVAFLAGALVARDRTRLSEALERLRGSTDPPAPPESANPLE
jgi:O-antigen/teichoic acid export membrane protein